MDPQAAVTVGLTLLNSVISLIAHLKAEAGMTDDQLIAHADSLDLQNKEDIKALLAM